jgi:3-hydroxybutyryl-CoA dehydrogenase
MRIGVVGSGTMGSGIAQVAAGAGHEVTLYDIDSDQLEDALERIEQTLSEGIERDKVTPAEKDATLGRIETTTDIDQALADAALVIEAVPEDMDLKREVFADIDAAAPDEAILATNTSSLSVTDIARGCDRPEQVIGLHFFSPPHIMGLVEVVVAEQTAAETKAHATAFVEGLGKAPIEVTDSPGFASSRLGVALGLEGIRMVETGVASPSDIDAAMRKGYGHPMGPLELTDHVGLDVRLDIAEHLRDELGERFRPPHLLRKKVRAGNTGKKSGEGFYVWDDGEKVGEADTGAF